MASYVKPMVMVYQEYATTSNSTVSADLPACIVGPCYHVVDSVEDATQALAGRMEQPAAEATAALYDNSGNKKNWLTVPSLVTGAVLETESCVLHLTDVKVRYATYVPFTIDTENRATIHIPLENVEDSVHNIPEVLSDGTTASGYILPKAAQVGDTAILYTRHIYQVPVGTPEGEGDEVVQEYTNTYGEWEKLCSRTIRSVEGIEDSLVRLNASVPYTLEREQAGQNTPPEADHTYVGLEFSACVYRNLPSLDVELSEFDADGYNADSSILVKEIAFSDDTFKFSELYHKIVTGVTYEGDEDVRVYHGALCHVSAANIYLGYRALRQDLTTGTIYSLSEVQGKLGKVCPENPLAFGMSIAVANSSGQGIIYAAVPSDDLEGYTTAKDRISNITPCYGIVPLTQSTSVLTMFKQHAISMSEPEVGMWRIAIGSTPLHTEVEVYKGIGSFNSDSNVLTANEHDDYDVPAFVSNGIVPGDEVRFRVTDTGAEYVYNVWQLLSDDQMMISSTADNPEILSGLSNVEFTITHSLDKTEQAKNIAAVSKSYNSRRYVNVWPDICSIDGEEHPSYYLGCAVAAGCGALPSQYGFTKLSLAGFDGLRHSNDYFNQEQLDLIAEGGTFIFVCDAEGAAPYVRHELTTDRSTIEFQELMFTKNFDYVSYIGKSVMEPFIGSWNVTNATLGAIRTALSSAFSTLMMDSREKIGAPIQGYEIISVNRLEATRDRVEAYVECDFPYPLNNIGLHIVSR